MDMSQEHNSAKKVTRRFVHRALLVVTAFSCGFLPCAISDDHYAAQNGQTPAGSYTTWETAASNIQDAVNAATTNDTVWVGAGRYTVPPNATNYVGYNVVFVDRPITLRSSNGIPEQTVIDGQASNRGVAVRYPFSGTNRIVLDGFTVSNCFATNTGGGVLFAPCNRGWTGEVRNCIIRGNTVGWGSNYAAFGSANDPGGSRGGGLGTYNISCSFGIVVSNCIIQNNTALHKGSGLQVGSEGGGVFIRANGIKNFVQCLVGSNFATTAGGIYMTGGSVENSILCHNQADVLDSGLATYYAGGGALEGGSYTLRNCLIYNNNAYRAGGIYLTSGGNFIYNSTIVSNRCISGGGGILMRFVHHANNAHLRIWNSIMYSNYTPNINVDNPTNTVEERLSLQVTNSCFTTNGLAYESYFNLMAPGKGNFTNNPQFVSFADNNFRLRCDSPCVNTGTNQEWMAGSADLDGRVRVRYGAVDMGACEAVYEGTLFGIR